MLLNYSACKINISESFIIVQHGIFIAHRKYCLDNGSFIGRVF